LPDSRAGQFEQKSLQPLPGGVNQPKGDYAPAGDKKQANKQRGRQNGPSTTTNQRWKIEVRTKDTKKANQEREAGKRLFKHGEERYPSPAP
jgi:hypothetical protein